jgi:hypothetical protein
MRRGTLFIGWGAIIPGRETMASNVLQDAMVFLHKLESEGVIDGIEVVLLEPHGGDLDGFVLIKGRLDQLAQLRVQDDFVKMIIGVRLVHSGVGVVAGHSGQEMQPYLLAWADQQRRLLGASEEKS